MSESEKNDKKCQIHKFERNNYFYGKLMSAVDFNDEQDYFNDKRHLINRLIYGHGLVCGLSSASDINFSHTQKDEILIEFKTEGVALDCCGQEIIIPKDIEKQNIITEQGTNLTWSEIPPSDGSSNIRYLYLRYKTCPGMKKAYPVSNISGCDEDLTRCMSTKCEEIFEVIVTEQPPPQDTLDCINLEGMDHDNALKEIKNWIEDKITTCATCNSEDTKVFFSAIKKINVSGKDKIVIDQDTTKEFTSFVYNNKLISELLICHLSDFDPHYALKSVNSVGNVGGEFVPNIDLISDGTIDIKPDNINKYIKIKTKPANSVTSVSITKKTGRSNSFAPEDHVHDLEDNVVTREKIRDQAIDETKIDADAVERKHFSSDVINNLLNSPDGSIKIISHPEVSKKNIDITTALTSRTGVCKLTMQNPISDPIDPGLGQGPICVVLGLEYYSPEIEIKTESDSLLPSRLIYIGYSEVFNNKQPVLLGARVDPETGMFQIGIRSENLYENDSKNIYKVRWWAFNAKEEINVIVEITSKPQGSLEPGGEFTYTATVTGAKDEVEWSIQENEGGTISESGQYVAPETEGTYHIIAKSKEHPCEFDMVPVMVQQIYYVRKTEPEGIEVVPSEDSVEIEPKKTRKIAGDESVEFTAMVLNSAYVKINWGPKELIDNGFLVENGTNSAVFNPVKPGNYEITATSGRKKGTATVKVIAKGEKRKSTGRKH